MINRLVIFLLVGSLRFVPIVLYFIQCGDDALIQDFEEEDITERIQHSYYQVKVFSNSYTLNDQDILFYGGTLNEASIENGDTVDQVVAIGSGGRYHYSLDGTIWRRKKITFEDFFIEDIYFDNAGTYTAVGPDGRLIQSQDLIDWNNLTYPLRNVSGADVRDWLKSIIVLDSERYLVAGASNRIYISDNASDWSDPTSSTGTANDDYNALASNGTNAIAVGQGGVILSSADDGDNWTRSLISDSADIFDDYTLQDVLFADPENDGGFYLVVGNNGTILKGSAGSWEKIIIDDWEIRAAANDINAASYQVTGIDEGADTITVTGDETANFIDGITFVIASATDNDGVFSVVSTTTDGSETVISVNEDIAGTTADGTITIADSNYFRPILYNICLCNDKFFILGQEGTVLSSDDALTWTIEDPFTLEDIYSMAFAFDQYIAAGYDRTIFTKTTIANEDGSEADWIQRILN